MGKHVNICGDFKLNTCGVRYDITSESSQLLQYCTVYTKEYLNWRKLVNFISWHGSEFLYCILTVQYKIYVYKHLLSRTINFLKQLIYTELYDRHDLQ